MCWAVTELAVPSRMYHSAMAERVVYMRLRDHCREDGAAMWK
jgi:hypothetical protein